MEQLIYRNCKESKELVKPTSKITLFCDEIKKNEDGSFLIHWGYYNCGSRSLTYASKDCQLIVRKGGAIMIPGLVPTTFVPGRHYACFSTIITEDTVLSWKVKKNILDFDIKQYLSNSQIKK